VSEPHSGPPAEPTTEPVPTTEPWKPGDPDRRADRAGQEPGDLGLALTPSQIFGGFALLAAAVVLLRRRARSRPDAKD